MTQVTSLEARYIYDSRGMPTVEVELGTKLGLFTASVGCGNSVGKHEVLDLRDRELSMWQGKGVTKVVAAINNIIAPALVDNESIDVRKQELCDIALLEMDGSENKNKFGANGILPVSIAICKAGAAKKRLPVYKHLADLIGNDTFVLPVPLFTLISGGKHSGSNIALQDLMIMPTGAKSFREAMQMASETFQYAYNNVKSKQGLGSCLVGDSGGLAIDVFSLDEAFELVGEAIKGSGYTKQIEVAVDVSATSFYKKEYDSYDLDFKNSKSEPRLFIDRSKLLSTYVDLIGKYQIASITDPFYQDHFDDWVKLRKACPRVQVVGDDLTATNFKRIKKVAVKGACNCLCIKLNQIGSVTEALKAYFYAKSLGWSVMISDRAGDTDEIFIADLAVGLSAGQFKAGGLCRSEHVAKYNYLMKIEEVSGRNVVYAGTNYRFKEET